MKLLETFEPKKIENLNAIKGGDWYYTGGMSGGYRDDMCVNGRMFCSNGDGTYSPDPFAGT